MNDALPEFSKRLRGITLELRSIENEAEIRQNHTRQSGIAGVQADH